MAGISPQQAAEKWARRTSQSTADITAGINRVTESPTQKAANKQAKMLANLTESVNNGKWARGLGRVSLEDWKRAAIEKGVPRIAQGVTAAQPKMAAFMSELLPYQESIRQKIQNLPDLTLEDNINRMTVFIRDMAKFQRK